MQDRSWHVMSRCTCCRNASTRQQCRSPGRAPLWVVLGCLVGCLSMLGWAAEQSSLAATSEVAPCRLWVLPQVDCAWEPSAGTAAAFQMSLYCCLTPCPLAIDSNGHLLCHVLAIIWMLTWNGCEEPSHSCT